MLLQVYRDTSIHGNQIAVLLGHGRRMLPRRLQFAGQNITVEPIFKHYRAPVSLELSSPRGPSENIAIGVSQQVLHRLRLPEVGQVHVRLHRDTWYLGPCLGIYVRTYSSANHPFGEQSRLLKELSVMANGSGVDLVVIGPGFNHARAGWRFDQKIQAWIKQSLPVPDIIYRRSGAFAAADSSLVLTDLRSFVEQGRLHTLPRKFSNKWRLHQMLAESPLLQPHILKTELVTSAVDLYRRVERYGDVYVKPLTGAQGNSIFRLQKSSNGIRVRWERPRRGLKPRDVAGRTFSTLKAFTDFWTAVGPKRCIVQETFRLPLTDDGDPFDLRWLVQYVDDRPEVIARVARIGKRGSVTTNIHTGGKPVDATKLLQHLQWKSADKLIQRVDEVAIAVTGACRKTYGPIVELGVDLALTETGEVRVFEVNSTPGRRMLRLISPDVREMSLRYLLEYAIYATGFAAES